MLGQESGSVQNAVKKPYVLAKKDRGQVVYWTGENKIGGVAQSVTLSKAKRFRSAKEANEIGSMSRGLARFRAMHAYNHDGWPDGFRSMWWW